MTINYDGRQFQGVANTDNGEVSGETRFHYHQTDAMLTGSYAGGSIKAGDLRGLVNEDGSLEFLYHHITVDGRLQAGHCTSQPTIDADGRIMLQESWQWLTGDRTAGRSTVREILKDA